MSDRTDPVRGISLKRSRQRRSYDLRTRPSAGAWRRSLVALLGLVVLFLNLIAPFSAPAHAVSREAVGTLAGQNGAIVDPVLGAMLICSSSPSLATTGEEGPGPLPSAGHGMHCPFCVPLLGASVVAPDAIEQVRYGIDDDRAPPRPRVIALGAEILRDGTARPRGPPQRV